MSTRARGLWGLLGGRRVADQPLTATQHTLVGAKFALLRDSSFGFTSSRLLHLQGQEVRDWSSACTAELRRQVSAATPGHVEPLLLDFASLQCLSLQCRHLRAPAGAETALDRYQAAGN